MSFTIRPCRHFPLQCAATYHAGLFLKLPPAYYSGFGQLTAPGLQRARIVELFSAALYCLTPMHNAPRVMLSGVKLRRLSYPSRFLLLPSVTDSSVSAALTP
jgi:hypothetical protein